MVEGTETISAADVLKQAGRAIPGHQMADFDPMEKIPTLAVGEDIVAGQLLTGVFQGTERLVSAKFTYSQEIDPETGLKVQYRHLMLNGKVKYGIWNCGELKQAFSKIAPGTYVEVTYIGKGENSKGQQQHNFKFRTQATTEAKQ